MSEQLRRDNHDVVTAQAAEEALELLAVQAVDCILMDVVMPGIDGLEACRRIRKIPGCERTPIMLLTMLEDRSLRQRAIEAGANDFVMKSADLELLRIRLRGVLRKQRIEPQKGGTASAPVSSPSAPPGQRSLFDQVVAASGIPAAADAIEKLCVRAGIDAKRMSAADLARALPIIGEFLSGSMTKEEASRRTAAISALARLWSRSRSS
jgi:DNA-binding response OmpR family regulator